MKLLQNGLLPCKGLVIEHQHNRSNQTAEAEMKIYETLKEMGLVDTDIDYEYTNQIHAVLNEKVC